jgi:hypothetical protein
MGQASRYACRLFVLKVIPEDDANAVGRSFGLPAMEVCQLQVIGRTVPLVLPCPRWGCHVLSVIEIHVSSVF